MVEQLSLTSAPEVYVQSKLLELSGKDEENLEKLGNFLKKENDLELKILYFNGLEKAKKYDTLYETTKHYLVDMKEDDWDTWKLFLESASHSGKLEDAISVVKNYAVTRNSQLALLELSKYSEAYPKDKYVANYISKYGHKLCLFPDLSTFVKPGDDITKILEAD
ncbi:unnamed protein product [Ambrosiozyma monospora]|uniref:Unnamed protein product n=1 Tax=Ambrosiozyma monospora TaxID=43982 RepID=A0ACB5UBD8_AMBMO|nr:unnamed protein product [Ambrosiozyma monospora]